MTFSNRFWYPFFTLGTLLLGGCTKKRTVYTLKPVQESRYTRTIDNVTLKVAYISPKQFKKIYPNNLGKYALLAEHESYVSKKEKNIDRRVRLLQGTLVNNSDKKLFIGRKNISLPTIARDDAYQKRMYLRNFSFGWLTAWGTFGLFIGYLSLAIPGGGIIAGVALGIAAPGAVVGTIEHLKHKDRKQFAHDTMLHNSKKTIKPGETYSWLMMIPYTDYTPHFTISCLDETNHTYHFDVRMNQRLDL